MQVEPRYRRHFCNQDSVGTVNRLEFRRASKLSALLVQYISSIITAG